MEDTWFSKLGFDRNPFTIRPAPAGYDLIGYGNILQEIEYRIDAGNMLFLQGPPGFGKTTVLKFVIRRFKGKRPLIYFNCNQMDEKLNVKKLMEDMPKSWRIFNNSKGIILLLDEVNEISRQNSEMIKYYYDEEKIAAVVFAGTSFDTAHLSESLRHRIGNRVLTLSKMTEEDSVLFIRNRIKDSQILSNTIIKKLFHISAENPRTLLENCEDICKFVTRHNRERVKESDIETVFGGGGA